MKRVIAGGHLPARTSNPEEGSDPPITAQTTVAEVLYRYPRCIHVLRRFGLNCCACVNAEVDTVESVARVLACPLPELLRELSIAAGHHHPNTAALSVEHSKRGI